MSATDASVRSRVPFPSSATSRAALEFAGICTTSPGLTAPRTPDGYRNDCSTAG